MEIDVNAMAQASGAGFSAGGLLFWFFRTHARRLTQCELDVIKAQRDLAEHRVYAEGAFAKKQSIDRLHDRIDDVSGKIDDMMKILIEQKGK